MRNRSWVTPGPDRTTVEVGTQPDPPGIFGRADVESRSADGGGPDLIDVLRRVDGVAELVPGLGRLVVRGDVGVLRDRCGAEATGAAQMVCTSPASAAAPISSQGLPTGRSVYPSQSRSATANAKPKRSPASATSPTPVAPWKSAARAPHRSGRRRVGPSGCLDGRPTPTARKALGEGDRHLKFHETRDNLVWADFGYAPSSPTVVARCTASLREETPSFR